MLERWKLYVLLVCSLLLNVYSQTLPQILDNGFGYQLPSPPEVAVWWCEATYKVGRQRALPMDSSSNVQIEAARNEYEPFQIVLRPSIILSNLTVSVSDFERLGNGPPSRIAATNVDVRTVDYVPVVAPSDNFGTAGEWPDPLISFSSTATLTPDTNQPLWFTVYVPKETPAGDYQALVTFSATGLQPFTIAVQLHVFNFSLSDVTHTSTAYYADVHVDPTWHKLSTLADRQFVWDIYMQNYRRHRVSPYSAQLYAPITWQLVNDEFIVDFTAFDEAMTRYLDEFDFTAFNLFGHKSPPFPTSLGGHEAFTPQYQELLSKLMDKIMSHLREKGWEKKAYCYWLDEPTPEQYPRLFAGMDSLRLAAPGLRRLVAWNNHPPAQYDLLLNGRVDIWTPVLGFATEPRFLERQKAGEETWWYVCTAPMAPYPNLFIDHLAINHRIRFWAAEKYGISGDLYYAVNMWSRRNPWLETRTWDWASANGDGVLLYPPTKSPPSSPLLAPPNDSIRWELTREALEDAEYFWLIKQFTTNALFRLGPENLTVLNACAAKEAALALVTNLTAYSKEPDQLYTARRQLAEAIEALNDGTPLFVKSPRSQAVALGETIALRSETLSWPPPIYQWRHNDVDLPGATNAFLILSNCGPSDAGTYTIVASNEVGATASAIAQVGGYWSDAPQIITHPTDLIRPEGESAIFSVTAVSSNTLSYQWLCDGRRLPQAGTASATLMLTNLATAQSGNYSVVISNVVGVITSRVARLIVVGNYAPASLIAIDEEWRYHDQGLDLGSTWRQPAYDDSAWPVGPAPLGFGNGSEATVLASGADAKPITVYFRQTFEMPEDLLEQPLTIRLRGDHGAVVYLNGMEVFRYNLPPGNIAYDTSALPSTGGSNGDGFVTFSLPHALLLYGTNSMAVEVHQRTDAIGPIAFWTFDETASPWRDGVGGHDFVAVGTNVISEPGQAGSCVTNNGPALSWLECPDAPVLRYTGPFTVGGWFAFDMEIGNDPATTCFEKQNEFRLYYTGTVTNRYRFCVGDAEVQDQTSGTTSGQWRFVVGWYDGTNANIQMDNGPVYSVPAAPPPIGTNPIVALQRTGLAGGFAVDEVFFYKRALSAAERTMLYTQGTREVIPTYAEAMAFNFELRGDVLQRPEFLQIPNHVVRRVGENAAFQLTAASSTPVDYQWLFNGTPLPGATNSLLFLPEVTPAQAGLYTLMASNVGGAVASAPARLTVVSPPLLEIQNSPAGNIALQWSPSDVAATLLSSTNLINWEVMTTVPPGATSTNWLITPDGSTTQRYYRLRLDW